MTDRVANSPAYECDLCGACCRTFPIFASIEDAAREPRITEESRRLAPALATETWEYQLFPLPFHEGCTFLDPENKCNIYGTRPDVCRCFSAGSDQCQEARARSGIATLLPVHKI